MAQIFISYAREEVAVAKLVKTGLQARGYTVTLDIDDFTRGSWSDQITAKLQAAQDVLVFVSPASLESAHVGDEVTQAITLGKPLVPVLLGEPPPAPTEWAQALLRNQAARYDALDFDVSLARIVRLLGCEPVTAQPLASAPEPPPAPSGPPRAPPRVGWGWLVLGLVLVAVPLTVWLVGTPPGPTGPPAAAASAATAPVLTVQPGTLRITFKGQIKREQIEGLEADLRQSGFAVGRSDRSEAARANEVVHRGPATRVMADTVRVRAQSRLDSIGCRLLEPLALRALDQPSSGDIDLVVVGSCP